MEEQKVESKCRVCGGVESFFVPASGMKARITGMSLRESFPDLPDERILQLAYHVCPACQGPLVEPASV